MEMWLGSYKNHRKVSLLTHFIKETFVYSINV